MQLQLMCTTMKIVILTQSIREQNVMQQHFQHRNKHRLIRHHYSPSACLQSHSQFIPHLYMGSISRSSQKTHQLSACLDFSLPSSSPLCSLYLCHGLLFFLTFIIFAITLIVQFFSFKNNSRSCNNSNYKEKCEQ